MHRLQNTIILKRSTMKETQKVQFMCDCFFSKWTTDVDSVIVFTTTIDKHATNNHKHCHKHLIAQTTNVGAKCQTLYTCIRHNICHLYAVVLIDKSKSIFVRFALASFYRMSSKMVRKGKANISSPKKVPSKTRKTAKPTKNQKNEDSNLNSDLNETSLCQTHGKETKSIPKKSASTAKSKGMND